MNPIVILIMIPSSILGAFGSLYLKKGSKKFTFNPVKFLDNITAGIGIFLFGLSTIFYIIALKFEDLSIVYPLSSMSYIFVALVSVKFLGEKMTKLKWIGIILIVLGSIMVVR